MMMRRISLALFPAVLLLLSAGPLRAQEGVHGLLKPIAADAGGMISIFNPDYVKTELVGFSAFADMTTAYRGLGVEAEGRWLRLHETGGVNEDTYLVGPRFAPRSFWKATPYIKVLGGVAHIDFGSGAPSGRFGVVALGGGVDFALSRRVSLRAVDYEYQEWPKFIGNALSPYGVSTGIHYRFF